MTYDPFNIAIWLMQQATPSSGIDLGLGQVIATAASGGAAVLVTIIHIIGQRRDDARDSRILAAEAERDKIAAQQHAVCNATIERVTEKFATTIELAQSRSDERFAQTLREAREAAERRDEKLYDFMKELRQRQQSN